MRSTKPNVENMDLLPREVPIVALATPPGSSAIAVIRLSGAGVLTLVNQIFQGKDLTQQPSHSIHFGAIYDSKQFLDEVLVSIFKAPKSFTHEDCVEISCHGSPFIIRQIIQLLVKHGARLAKPGEFTQRAFLHGRFDLAQAEAVADLIAAESALAHRTALHQLRGGFSAQLKALRKKLVHFAARLELALDFAEEDVAFADTAELKTLVQAIIAPIEQLIQSFALGNVIKEGLPIVLAGPPNAGKSTLLNAFLNEEKAIVSAIPGTTRDVIEGTVHWEGLKFRFVDTAGLRDKTTDEIEAIGMAKTKEQLKSASLILYLFDVTTDAGAASYLVAPLKGLGIPLIKVGNKLDAAQPALLQRLQQDDDDLVLISAVKKQNLGLLKARILAFVQRDTRPQADTIVVNARHYESLSKTKEALVEVSKGITQKLSPELLVVDIRKALHHLGEITGEVTTEDVLTTIFSQFCIGK